MCAARIALTHRPFAFVCALTLATTLGACGSPSGESAPPAGDDSVPIEVDTTDTMYQDDVDDAVLYVFRYEGDAIEATSADAVDVGEHVVPEDGSFYKVVADVTYLNGGIAGYVNYPEVHTVKSSAPVSPADMGLSQVTEHPYGVALIGDYADGDILLYTYKHRAVWKDGAWTYRYDDELKLSDGRTALVREGISEDDVQGGVDAGTLSCADYFVLP